MKDPCLNIEGKRKDEGLKCGEAIGWSEPTFWFVSTSGVIHMNFEGVVKLRNFLTEWIDEVNNAAKR